MKGGSGGGRFIYILKPSRMRFWKEFWACLDDVHCSSIKFLCENRSNLIAMQLTFRSLFDNIIYCLFGNTYSWDYNSKRHTANTFRGMEFQPLSWCIDHKSAASTNRRLMWDLLKLMPEIYGGVQVALKHSSVSSDCLTAAVWWAMDWFVQGCPIRQQCPQPTSYCLVCCNSRSLSSFAVVVLLYISFQWEL